MRAVGLDLVGRNRPARLPWIRVEGFGDLDLDEDVQRVLLVGNATRVFELG